MPRKPTQFPPYPSKPHTSGQARLKIGGRHRYLGVHGSKESWAEYERLLARWRAGLSLDDRTPAASATLTVSEVLARWEAHALETYSATGREYQQFRHTVRPLVALHGTLPAKDFTAELLEQLLLVMASGAWMPAARKARYAKTGHSVGWSRAVINRRLVRIKTVWKWAEKRKLVPPGSHAHLCTVRPLSKTERRVKSRPRRPAATWEKVAAVLPHVQSGRHRRPAAAMIELQWWTGMRSGEVRVMRAGEIDRSRDVWVYQPESHKNDWRDGAPPRRVPLGPECQRVLSPWLLGASPDDYLFRPRPAVNRPYSCTGYAQVIRRAARAAGVALQPYDCRHGAKMRITRALGADAARAVLGQQSIEATQHYGSLDLEHAIETAKKLA